MLAPGEECRERLVVGWLEADGKESRLEPFSEVAEDEPQRSRPTLPGVVAEEVHGQDPKLEPDTRLPSDPAALHLLGRWKPLAVLTGIEGHYDPHRGAYLPPAPYRTWNDVVRQNGLSL